MMLTGAPSAATTRRPNAAAHGRRLVLHADDFGMNPAVNRGILAGFAEGLLTSTSILANAPAFTDALRAWKELLAVHELDRLPSAEPRCRLGDPHLPFDFGVHLNLTQGRPLTGACFPPQFLDRHGRFLDVFRLLPRLLTVGRRLRRALRDELCAQIERVLEQGFVPTHLNGHQYIELLPVIAGIVPELLERFSIRVVRVAWERDLTRTTILHRFRPAPWFLAQVKRLFAFDCLLRMSRAGAAHPAAYCGTAHAGRIDIEVVRRFIQAAGTGLTEIGVHPGDVPSAEDREMSGDGWDDPLAALRPTELDWLRSRELVGVLANQHVDLSRLSALRPRLPNRIAQTRGRHWEGPEAPRAPHAGQASAENAPPVVVEAD